MGQNDKGARGLIFKASTDMRWITVDMFQNFSVQNSTWTHVAARIGEAIHMCSGVVL